MANAYETCDTGIMQVENNNFLYSLWTLFNKSK